MSRQWFVLPLRLSCTQANRNCKQNERSIYFHIRSKGSAAFTTSTSRTIIVTVENREIFFLNIILYRKKDKYYFKQNIQQEMLDFVKDREWIVLSPRIVQVLSCGTTWRPAWRNGSVINGSGYLVTTCRCYQEG